MRKPLILIVEDDDATAECLADLLRAEGYDTRVLAAPAAVDAIRRTQPDLMLLDLVFPDSKGEDLLRDVRCDHELGDLPVILISAVPHLADTAARLPVQGYVTKPFELDFLLQTVGSAVRRPPLPEAAADACMTPAGSASGL